MATIDLPDVRAARSRITPYVRRTPLERSTTLSRMLGTNLYLKYESFQKTGSFKPRGAFNQLRVLMDESDADRFVGVSGGNFAQGLAYAGAVLGVSSACLVAAVVTARWLPSGDPAVVSENRSAAVET